MNATRKCGKCNRIITYKFSHVVERTSRNKGSPIFIDQRGRQWKNATCPDCTGCYGFQNRKLGKKHKLTKRKCNVCGKPLPIERYFNHIACIQGYTSDFHDLSSMIEFHEPGGR